MSTIFMLSRIVAGWLVLLIFAPFTAPFPTCDMATLFGCGPAHHVPVVPAAPSAVSHDAAVVNAPAALRTVRIRVLSTFRMIPVSSQVSYSSSTRSRSSAAMRDGRDDAALRVVLRV
jgi:hypothetical protein